MFNWSNLCLRLWIFIPNKNAGSKYRQKLLDITKKSATGSIKTDSIKAIQNTAETTGDLVANKISEKIVRAASETTHKDPGKLKTTQIYETSVQPTETSKEIYIPPGRRRKNNHDLWLL